MLPCSVWLIFNFSVPSKASDRSLWSNSLWSKRAFREENLGSANFLLRGAFHLVALPLKS
jgi:hypothetical protein